MPLIGAVYDLKTKQVLRIVVPDNDTQLTTVNWAGHGEGFLALQSADLPTDPYLYNEFVAQAVADATASLP